jgi:hypothetical protein
VSYFSWSTSYLGDISNILLSIFFHLALSFLKLGYRGNNLDKLNQFTSIFICQHGLLLHDIIPIRSTCSKAQVRMDCQPPEDCLVYVKVTTSIRRTEFDCVLSPTLVCFETRASQFTRRKPYLPLLPRSHEIGGYRGTRHRNKETQIRAPWRTATLESTREFSWHSKDSLTPSTTHLEYK